MTELATPSVASGAWAPPVDSSITAHDGQPIPPEVEFFAAPPPEIGPVRTANSTMARGQRLCQIN